MMPHQLTVVLLPPGSMILLLWALLKGELRALACGAFQAQKHGSG